jgi:hypothetical protein
MLEKLMICVGAAVSMVINWVSMPPLVPLTGSVALTRLPALSTMVATRV